MRGGTCAHSRAWLPQGRGQGWGWLGAALLAALAATASLAVFSGYQRSYEPAAAGAAAAEVAASRLSALASEAVAGGHVPPGVSGRAGQLLAALGHDMRLAGADGAAPRYQLAVYGPAVRADLRLLAAGRAGQARRADEQRVAPVYRSLWTGLRQLADRNERAARRAAALAQKGGIGAAGAGFGAALLLLAGFAAARRRLAAAEAEQRLRQHSSQLISGVSGDLRIPLTALTGYLELLADGQPGPLTAEQQRLLTAARRSGSRLHAMADDLLFIAGARAARAELAWEELSMQQLAAAAVQAQQPAAASAGITLSLAAQRCPLVPGDRQRLDDLLDNLLSSALTFTPRGGAVAVTVQPADGHVRLEVSGSGPGLPAGDQRGSGQVSRGPGPAGRPGSGPAGRPGSGPAGRPGSGPVTMSESWPVAMSGSGPGAMSESWPAGRPGSGPAGRPESGLGLVIVQAVADAHHANVSVRGEPGADATFRVDFPAAGAVAQELPVTGNYRT